MANEIFTRIQLKYDSYANWTSNNPTLLAGEVAIAKLVTGTQVDVSNDTTNTAPVLFKVGPGEFNSLPWVSGLAADVYAWAKESSLYMHKDGTGNVVSGVEWDATLNEGKGGLKYTTASVATSEELETLQKEVYGEGGSADNSRIDKIEKDIADNRASWVLDTDTQYFFSVDGDKLVVKKALFTNGEKGTEENVGSYEFLTADEARAIADDLIGRADITIEAGDGLTTGGSFNVNQNNATTITIDHEVPTGAVAKKYKDNSDDEDSSIVTSITTDKFGHIVGAETASGVVTLGAHDTFGEGKEVVLTISGPIHTGNVATHLAGKAGIKVTAEDAGVDTRIYVDGTDLLQAAKDYADAKPHENTAHTHSAGDGLKITGVNGGITGDTKYELNLAFGELTADNKLQLIDADNNAVIAEFNAAAFVEDSYLKSVTYSDTDGDNKLTFVFELNNGDTTTVDVDLSHLVDVYVADETTITLVTSGDGKVFKIKDGGVGTSQIAEKAVTEEKLEQDVQDALALARTAIQRVDCLNGDGTQRNINVFGLSTNGTNVIIDAEVKESGIETKHIATDAVTTDKVTDKNITKAKLEQSVQTSLDKADSAVQNLIGLTEDLTEHNIDVFVNFGGTTDGTIEAEVKESGIETKHIADKVVTTAKLADDVKELIKTEAANLDAVVLAESQKYTDEAIGDLHAIATSGSIYDVAEGHNVSTGTDAGAKYIIFNCGSSTTVI